MNVSVAQAEPVRASTALLALAVAQGTTELSGTLAAVDQALGGQLSRRLQNGDFRGKRGEALLLFPEPGQIGAGRVLLVGLGKPEKVDAEALRRAAAAAVKQAVKYRLANLALAFGDAAVAAGIEPETEGQAIAEGAVLGAYAFRDLKTSAEPDEQPVEIRTVELLGVAEERADGVEAGARIGAIVARAENLARTLGNLPGNVVTPAYLADTAQRIADEWGLRCTVLDRAAIRDEGLAALLAVSQGSEQEPRLIVLEHRGGGGDEAPLVLIGKGLTFDAGGVSIKPAAGMEEMKFDMCGGAAVLAAMQAVAELGVPANVVGIVPSSENLLSGAAMKPGDIIETHLGKTVEVVNTDAEGRLILADALSYARRFNPAAVVDAATLTGACVVALGHEASAVMGNDEALIAELRAAGERVGERAWPLPMYEEYKEQLRSDYADIKNVGGRPASSITAGWFLREFVGEFAWAHLDIAGTAYGDGKLPYQTKGATGAPTRLFVEWVRGRAG